MARRSVEPSTMSLLGLVRHLAEMFVFMLQRTEDALEGPKAFAEKRKPEWKMRLAPSRGNAGAGACRG
jgi:1,4-dihydroxy-2-naphthoyl-CoA synthase